MTFPDAEILERRLEQLRQLPWPIPATMLLEITEEYLDTLAEADDPDEYWHTLNHIVMRSKRAESLEANGHHEKGEQ